MSEINSNKKVSAMQNVVAFCSYYKPYMPILIADLICATLYAVVDLAFPQVLRFFTYDFFTREAQEIISILLPLAAGLVLLYLIRTACIYYVCR